MIQPRRLPQKRREAGHVVAVEQRRPEELEGRQQLHPGEEADDDERRRHASAAAARARSRTCRRAGRPRSRAARRAREAGLRCRRSAESRASAASDGPVHRRRIARCGVIARRQRRAMSASVPCSFGDVFDAVAWGGARFRGTTDICSPSTSVSAADAVRLRSIALLACAALPRAQTLAERRPDHAACRDAHRRRDADDRCRRGQTARQADTTSSSPARASSRIRTTRRCRCRSSPRRNCRAKGITSPEQLIMFLSTNGNGADNLASNADVTSGAQRGTNGLSAANLRGQGSASTLVLLNGRRVAAHGLTGGGRRQPDPVRRDRARRGAEGRRVGDLRHRRDRRRDQLHHQARTSRASRCRASPTSPRRATARSTACRRPPATAISTTHGFNVMGAVSQELEPACCAAHERDFVNTNQPNRGLSVDTRGTPIATAFPINPTAADIGITQTGTLLGGTTTAPPAARAGLPRHDDARRRRHQHARPARRRGLRFGRRRHAPTTSSCGTSPARATPAPGTPAAPRCSSSRSRR